MKVLKETDLSKELQSLKGTIDPENAITYVPRWPLIMFLATAICCFSFSTVFHIYQAHSFKAWSTLLKLDYGGICLLIMGSYYPVSNYVFACQEVSFLKYFFLALNTICCLASFIFMMVDKYSTPEWKWLRGLLFIILGTSGAVPFLYLQFASDHGYFSAYSVQPWALGGAIYIVGAFMQVNNWPEKKYPKKFDIIGSSHQIFHVCVVIACAIHFEASF